MTDPSADAGRSCPLHYRYGAEALNRPVDFAAETLLVVGGLYGNIEALDWVLDYYRAECERTAGPVWLIFNGDFHWFDAEPAAFRRINEAVLGHHAIQGNVEAELGAASGAGCGCGYPDYVGQATVDRSNAIMAALQETAAQVRGARQALAALPMHALVDVGGERVAVIHGDPDHLAGWSLAAEALAPADEALRTQLGCQDLPLTGTADVLAYAHRAGCRVFASTHTCLPVVQGFVSHDGEAAVINNGSSGMPNFAGDPRGLLTRISIEPSAAARYRLTLGALHLETVAMDFDAERWRRRFERWWPEGSPAFASYHGRISQGPDFTPAQAFRGWLER